MKVFIKSTDKIVLINPKTMQQLEENGEYVFLDAYWRRRIKEGTAFLIDKKELEEKQTEDEVTNDLV